MSAAKPKKRLRILISNDDGIHAPGLEAAERIAHQISDDVWVVAPETEQSGASHSLTLTLPLRLRRIGPKRFAIQGTPTDCVMMAVLHLMKDGKPDLVLSGVNRGYNVADDVTYSGTVAAAMEGTALGIPSIAMSQSCGDLDELSPPWACAEAHAPALIKRLIDVEWPQGVLLNINFPDLPPEQVTHVAVTTQGTRDQSMLRVDERVDARGQTYFWIGFKRLFKDPETGTDLHAIAQGRISVTPLHLNLTEMRQHERLAKFVDGPLAALESSGIAALIGTLRREGVSDERVLAAIAQTPRELFVEEGYEREAFRDTALPIACGQTISQPYIVAYMSEALGVRDNMRVLEIGTGSGYQTAVLARLAKTVYTVERHLPLLKKAEARFKALGLNNIVARHADGFQGWGDEAPFDRIIVTAAFREVPKMLADQLGDGGILVAPVGYDSISQRLVKMVRTGQGMETETLLPVVFVPMVKGLAEGDI